MKKRDKARSSPDMAASADEVKSGRKGKKYASSKERCQEVYGPPEYFTAPSDKEEDGK